MAGAGPTWCRAAASFPSSILINEKGRSVELGQLPEAPAEVRAKAQEALETLLTAAPALRHLAESDPELTGWFLLKLKPFHTLTGQPQQAKILAEKAVESNKSGGSDENLAPCLGTLGTVQSALGEREAARDSYQEALEIYRRLAMQWPKAFANKLYQTLKNYAAVTDEHPDDPWWALWRQFEEASDPDEG